MEKNVNQLYTDDGYHDPLNELDLIGRMEAAIKHLQSIGQATPDMKEEMRDLFGVYIHNNRAYCTDKLVACEHCGTYQGNVTRYHHYDAHWCDGCADEAAEMADACREDEKIIKSPWRMGQL